MVEIQTILCPVDFSAATARQVDFAADLCRLFGARLVLQHNLGEVGPGAAVGWMWAATHQGPPPEAAATETLKKLMAEGAAGLATEARLTHGPPTSSVLRTAELAGAALIVMGEHTRAPIRRWFRRDTSRFPLHHSHCPVWYVPSSPVARGEAFEGQPARPGA